MCYDLLLWTRIPSEKVSRILLHLPDSLFDVKVFDVADTEEWNLR